MHSIEWDGENGILKLTFSGFVGKDEMQQFQSEIEAILAKLTPGFRVLTDFTGMEEMDAESIPTIRETMDTFRQKEVLQIVRVVPDPLKDVGFNILSYFHYGRDANVKTCETLPEALKALNLDHK